MSATASHQLRHVLATLAYRAGKVLRDAPPDFGSFSAGHGTRTPLRVLGHMGDLLDWALQLADGKHIWAEADADDWDAQVARFFDRLESLDEWFASGRPLGFDADKLFQGPFADALTHVGQLAMLRRMAGSPVRGENYFKADIRAGHVGPVQAAPRYEFD